MQFAAQSFGSMDLPLNYFIIAFAVVFGICLIAFASWGLTTSKNIATPQNVQRINEEMQQSFEKDLEPFQRKKGSIFDIAAKKNENLLINYAPLTITNAAYLGPFQNGVFDENEGVAQALKAGARGFFLPIDFHEDSTLSVPLFGEVGAPCLLMRDGGGNMRSLNKGSIEKFTIALAEKAFSNIIFQKDDPIILVLHFQKTPPANTLAYLRFCSAVARELQPLAPFLLTQTPDGVFSRQAKQDEILYMDIDKFSRKVLIFCNIDTKIYANTARLGIKQPIKADEDLDAMVNLRLFRQSENSQLLVTSFANQNQFARGILETVDYYATIPESRKQETIDSTKIRWTIALPRNPNENPKEKETKSMLAQNGVQMIPLKIFDLNAEDKKLLALWNKSAWIFKPEPIRFIRPSTFTPKRANPSLNANGGSLSVPSM